MPDLRPGDEVEVHDTGAKKFRQGFVRRTYPDGKVDVFILRYNSVIHFNDQGTTPLGRFILKLKV